MPGKGSASVSNGSSYGSKGRTAKTSMTKFDSSRVQSSQVFANPLPKLTKLGNLRKGRGEEKLCFQSDPPTSLAQDVHTMYICARVSFWHRSLTQLVGLSTAIPCIVAQPGAREERETMYCHSARPSVPNFGLV